jgi:hypothetical protein
MPCKCCKKKGIPIPCTYCDKSFCSSCIQLEIHGCEGIQKKLDIDKENLGKKLNIDVIRKKVAPV